MNYHGKNQTGILYYSGWLKKGESFITLYGIPVYIWIAAFLILSLSSVLIALRLFKDIMKK